MAILNVLSVHQKVDSQNWSSILLTFSRCSSLSCQIVFEKIQMQYFSLLIFSVVGIQMLLTAYIVGTCSSIQFCFVMLVFTQFFKLECNLKVRGRKTLYACVFNSALRYPVKIQPHLSDIALVVCSNPHNRLILQLSSNNAQSQLHQILQGLVQNNNILFQ